MMDQSYVVDITNAFRIPPEYFPEVLSSAKPSSQIVPDDVQSELIMLKEKKRDIYFRIGDIANELILMHKGTVTSKKVYSAVSLYCDCSPRTVRYYAETSGFFPINIRADYDSLSFTHFDIARNYKHNWQFVLEYALSNPTTPTNLLSKQINLILIDKHKKNNPDGKPVCDSVLNHEIIFKDGEIETLLTSGECATIAGAYDCSQIGNVVMDYTRPIAHNSAQLVGSISELSEKVIQLVEGYGDKLPEEVRDNVLDSLVRIIREIPAITLALDLDGAK